MDDALTKLRGDLAKLRAEHTALGVRIAELETAERVLLYYLGPEVDRIISGDAPSVSGAVRREETGGLHSTDQHPIVATDLFGKSIRDAAKILLVESHPEAMDYPEIARQALARGYRSHKSGDDLDKITRSFYETLRRHPDEFEQQGSSFKVRTEASPAMTTSRDYPSARMSQAEAAASVFDKTGQSLKINDILDRLSAAGYQFPNDMDHAYNSMHKALRRHSSEDCAPPKFRKSGDGSWVLVEPSRGEEGDQFRPQEVQHF